jgi:hypothetical protein
MRSAAAIASRNAVVVIPVMSIAVIASPRSAWPRCRHRSAPG